MNLILEPCDKSSSVGLKYIRFRTLSPPFFVSQKSKKKAKICDINQYLSLKISFNISLRKRNEHIKLNLNFSGYKKIPRFL